MFSGSFVIFSSRLLLLFVDEAELKRFTGSSAELLSVAGRSFFFGMKAPWNQAAALLHPNL